MPKSRGKSGQRKPQEFSLEEPRRGFMYKCLAAGVGAAAGAVPLAVGVYHYGDPLRPAKHPLDEKIRVARIEEVPDDGVPRRFEVIADRWDKWTFTPQQTIGAVYLVRQSGDPEPTAFNVTCPHAGCAVALRKDAQGSDIFKCPCHNSTFNLDGSLYRPKQNPSPRSMDALTCTVEEGEVWVQYKNFYTGISEKVEKE